MAPQALASVHALFPPHERSRALSIYGITLGLSSVVGQLLGGALVAADIGGFGWRLIFFINLPVALAAFVAAIPLLRETRPSRRPRLDLGGVVLSAAALGAVVLPLTEGREQNWPLWSIIVALAAPLLGEAFRRYEGALAARGGEPLVPMDAFSAPGLLRGLGAILTLYAMAAFFLTFAIYTQAALGRSALQSGVAILPVSIGFLIGSYGSPYFGRLAGKAAPSLGFFVSAAGAAWLALVATRAPAVAAPPFAPMTLSLMLMGLGMGSSIPTMMRVVVERVDPHRAGLVGGLVNSMLQVSAAIGVAALGGLFYAVLGQRSDAQSIAHAFASTLLGVAACHTVGGLLALGLGQPRAAKAAPPVEEEAAIGVVEA